MEDLKPKKGSNDLFEVSFTPLEKVAIVGSIRSRVGTLIMADPDYSLGQISDHEIELAEIEKRNGTIPLSIPHLEELAGFLEEFATSCVAAIRDCIRSTSTPDHANNEIINTVRKGKVAEGLAKTIREKIVAAIETATEKEIERLERALKEAAEPDRTLRHDNV